MTGPQKFPTKFVVEKFPEHYILQTLSLRKLKGHLIALYYYVFWCNIYKKISFVKAIQNDILGM